ncbi:DUF1289 domain-containing protein [Variovorax rhizosphaerae]|uniref:DUF1289 domain-containing protein n=1 Tax=Variovorax rhizosphaerae TaxID=1836200 RepID=A0ABU8WIJ6_9BURK
MPEASASMRDDAAFDALAAQALATRAAEVIDEEPVPSPCISVCRIHDGSGLCLGCFRTLREIAQWSRMDGPGKRQVWARIAQRIDESISSP